MFKKRKKNREQGNPDDSGKTLEPSQINMAKPSMVKRPRNEDEEDDDVVLDLMNLKQKSTQNVVKHKLKTLNYDDMDVDEATNGSKNAFPKSKKSKVNAAAVASVSNIGDVHDHEPQSRYSVDDLENLRQSQIEINKSVSDYISQVKPTLASNDTNEELSDEFTEDEIAKMKNVKEIKRKILRSDGAMNTKKDEFLAPKDIHIAEQTIHELSQGVYAMNSSKDDQFEEVEDFGENESWIEKQLQSALGVNHEETDTAELARYHYSDQNHAFEQPEIKEVRGIKA